MEQRVSDEKVRLYLSGLMGGASASTLQHYRKEERNHIIKQLKDFGASIRQISRLTGVSFGIIRNIQ
jgi:transposase-like protein